MGDAARELAHRLHLLRLTQLLLQTTALRHITGDEDELDRLSSLVPHEAAVRLQPHPMTVFVPYPEGDGLLIARGRKKAGNTGRGERGVVRMDERTKTAADEFLRLVA